ncbi:MAG: efflux RND transporter periplasmic adaptor subunit [Gammaproteobacteria bacterium]|nr:efflux RND transporter periplasmic adaptor subunit [Gammaproteobacteria bacterium]MDG2336831.1 efflux RND transporter periplasmic adaptor subunit [Gammaproteobacteria bacterium]
MKRVIFPIGILAGCIFFAAVLLRSPTVVDEAAPEIIPVSVRVAQVRAESIQLNVESQGKVQASQVASLSAPVAGPVAWISSAMEAGGFVKEGESLLRLESSDYETTRARSLAAMQQAQAESTHASNELDRLRELADKRLASDSQLQDAIRMANVNIARLADAQASFQQAELDLDRANIRAPFDAIIQSRDVELGQFVNRAQSVAVLLGATEVEVRVPLAIRQLGFLDVPLGMRGELGDERAPNVILTGLYGGAEYNWSGKLVRTEAVIDANSNTVQTIIRVKQPVANASAMNKNAEIPLPIGLYVQATIQGRRVSDLIALPRSVIRNNNQVLVVDAENKMYYRNVEIYRLEEDRVLISGGILPGEFICISPIQAVVNGMSVQPVTEVI